MWQFHHGMDGLTEVGLGNLTLIFDRPVYDSPIQLEDIWVPSGK